MDPALIFILIAFGIIVLALLIGATFRKTVTKQMPGQRDGTGAGFGVDVAHGAKSKGWLDGDGGSDGGAGGGGGGD